MGLEASLNPDVLRNPIVARLRRVLCGWLSQRQDVSRPCLLAPIPMPCFSSEHSPGECREPQASVLLVCSVKFQVSDSFSGETCMQVLVGFGRFTHEALLEFDMWTNSFRGWHEVPWRRSAIEFLPRLVGSGTGPWEHASVLQVRD